MVDCPDECDSALFDFEVKITILFTMYVRTDRGGERERLVIERAVFSLPMALTDTLVMYTLTLTEWAVVTGGVCGEREEREEE